MMIFTVSAWFRCSWIRLTDMDLSLRRLRMLRELHRRGTVTAVAEALHYSPSGISQQLAQLERDVGVVLVERFGRRIRLTELGLLLAEHAEDILTSVDRASMALEQAQGGVSARLTAGVWASVASGLVTPALGALAKAYPGLEVRTVELAPESTAEAVMDGSLDFSFVIDYMNYPLVWDPTLVREVIAVERLYAAVPAGSIPGTTVALLDLSEHPWILAGSRSHLGKAVLLACRQQGFDPQIMHTVEEQSTALAMVAGGLGVSLVSDLALDSVPEGVSIVALDQPVMRTVSIARRRAAGPRSALDLVIDAVRTAAAEKGIAADTEPPLEAGSVEDR